MVVRKGGPHHDRVSELHAKLFGSKVSAGQGSETIGYAQQLVYLEESCTDILQAIKAIEHASDQETHNKACEELKSSLSFVARLCDDRELLNAVRKGYSYRQRRR
jgi:hypothetical protein